DPRTGEPKGEPLWRDRPVRDMAFSPDGKALLARYAPVVGGTTHFRLWDLAQGKVVGPTVQPHGYVAVFDVHWSRDSRRVLTAAWDRTAQLWDAATGQPRLEPFAHRDAVERAVFSPDEKTILTTSKDATARLWD